MVIIKVLLLGMDLDTTLIFGGGLPTTYSNGVVRFSQSFGADIIFTVKEAKLMPYAENLIIQLNNMFIDKIMTLDICQKYCETIKEMFWDIDGIEKDKYDKLNKEYEELRDKTYAK